MAAKDGWDAIDVSLEEDGVAQEELLDSPEVEVEEELPEEDDVEERKGGGRAEKRIKQLVTQRNTEKERAALLESELQTLRNELNGVKRTQTDFELSQAKAARRSIEDAIAEMNSAWVQAQEEGDYKKALEHQNKKDSLTKDLNTLQAWESAKEMVPVEPVPQVQQAPALHPKAAKWLRDNQDVVMDDTKRAEVAEWARFLEAQGFTPADDEYYDRIEERLNVKFGDEEEGRTSKRRSPVSSKGRTGVSKGRNKVSLSREEQNIARKYNMTVEDFAREKLAHEKAIAEGDGYVEIQYR